MQVTFEFWGVLERTAGRREHCIELREPATVEGALASLLQVLPALAPHVERAAVANGERLLLRSEPLQNGQRLALLPPVAGG